MSVPCQVTQFLRLNVSLQQVTALRSLPAASKIRDPTFPQAPDRMCDHIYLPILSKY